MNGLDQTQNYSSDETIRLFITYSPDPINDSSNPSQITITNPLSEVDIVLNQFEERRWEISNRDEISLYLENNPGLVIQLKDAIEHIPKLIKYPFTFRLGLVKDMEIEDFVTLCLFIVGKFTPKQAFNLLQKIDKKWTNRKISDVTEFNVNVEFL